MSPAFYPYSSDSNERQHFIVHATLLAVLISYLLHLAKSGLASTMAIPWYVELPTFATLTFAIYFIATHFTWRAKWFRFVFRVRIPDLNGTWEGYLVSSFDKDKQVKCSLTIEQTWNSIGLTFETDQSRSCNGITGIAVQSPGGARLIFEYINTPKAFAATEEMHRHEGTQWLTLVDDGKELTLGGEYYTGSERKTYGVVSLRRKKSA
jgi:SMODS-associating 2TM, beta-strand rich effector domain